jgi:hypothetical protein
MDNLAMVAIYVAVVVGAIFAIWAGLNVMKNEKK